MGFPIPRTSQQAIFLELVAAKVLISNRSSAIDRNKQFGLESHDPSSQLESASFSIQPDDVVKWSLVVHVCLHIVDCSLSLATHLDILSF